jgi:hypothetical protein
MGRMGRTKSLKHPIQDNSRGQVEPTPINRTIYTLRFISDPRFRVFIDWFLPAISIGG